MSKKTEKTEAEKVKKPKKVIPDVTYAEGGLALNTTNTDGSIILGFKRKHFMTNASSKSIGLAAFYDYMSKVFAGKSANVLAGKTRVKKTEAEKIAAKIAKLNEKLAAMKKSDA